MKDNDSINEKTINSIMSGDGDKLISAMHGKVILYGVGKKKLKLIQSIKLK